MMLDNTHSNCLQDLFNSISSISFTVVTFFHNPTEKVTREIVFGFTH